MNGSSAAPAAIAALIAACAAGSTLPAASPEQNQTLAAALSHPDGAIVATVPLTKRPFGVAVSHQDLVYVTRLDANSLAVTRLPDVGFTAGVAVGKIPGAVAFTRNGQTAYVTNQFSDHVSVVRVPGGDRQVDTIPVTGDPFEVIVAPDDRTIFVSANVDTVYRIDRRSHEIVAKFGVPTAFGVVMIGMTFTRDGRLFYTTTRVGGTVIEYRLSDNLVLRTIPLGFQAQGVAVAPDGSELYIADESGNRLVVWDLVANTLRQAVPLGGSPFDLKLTPDGAQVWVGVRTSGEVRVFDRVTRALVVTIPTGGQPRRIAFDRRGTTAVVANESGWVDIVR